MKSSWKIIIVVLGLILFFIIRSNWDLCISKKDLPGTYVYNRNLNTFDTLFIKSNGRYTEKIYDKKGTLIVVRNSYWKCNKVFANIYYPLINFKNMILNDDRKLSTMRNYNNTKMDLFTSVIQDNGIIKIEMDSDLGFYYVKYQE